MVGSCMPMSDVREPCRLFELNNAIVTQTTIDRKKKTFTGCVYDEHGRVCEASQRTSKGVEWRPADPKEISIDHDLHEINGLCIYMGHMTSHYGHFLLETLSRFWTLLEGLKYSKLVFHPFVHSVPKIPGYSPLKACIECFGIDKNDILIVEEDLRFKRLAVPTPLVEINDSAEAEQIAVYQKIIEYCRRFDRRHSGSVMTSPIENNGCVKSDQISVYDKLLRFCKRMIRRDLKLHPRIYLSRRRLRWRRQLIQNEAEIEKVFTSRGFKVVYPEKYDFIEQVLMYNHAEVVAGLTGSALHNSVFMNSGSTVITLGSIRGSSEEHRNQEICNSLAKVCSEFIAFQGKIYSEFIPFQGKVYEEPVRGKYDVNYLRERLSDILC